MAEGDKGRKFLIEFMVEADQAVEASDQLADSLKGVSGNVNVASESVADAQSTVAKAGTVIGGSAQAVNQGVTGISSNATMLNQTLMNLFAQSNSLQESAGGMAGHMEHTGESFGASAKKGLMFAKTLMGVEHLFMAIEKRSPLHFLMGLAVLFVKLDHLLGSHKKKWVGLTDAQQLAKDKAKAYNSVAGQAAKILREQAAATLASATMTTDAAKAEDLRAQAAGAMVKAQGLEKSALEGVVSARLSEGTAVGKSVKGHKKLTLLQRIGLGLDKIGLKSLSKKLKLTKGLTKATGGLAGATGEAAGAAAEAEGAAAGGGGMAALAAALPLILAALPAIAFSAMALGKALKPIGRIFGRLFDTFEFFIEVIGLPLLRPLEMLEEVMDDVMSVFDDLADALEPVLDEMGEVLAGPIADAGKVFVNLIKEVLGAGDGFSTIVAPIKEVAEHLGPLASEIAPLLKESFIAMKPVLGDLAKNMGQFFEILMEAFVEMVHVLPTFIEMLPDFLHMVADLGKILLPIFKALIPILGFIAKVQLKLMAGYFKAVSFVIDGVTKAIEWLGKVGEQLGIWFEQFWFDLKNGAADAVKFFQPLIDTLGAIAQKAKDVWNWLFGSGLWAIPEAAPVAVAGLTSIGKALDGISDKAADVKGELSGLGTMGAMRGAPAPTRVLSGDATSIGTTPSSPLHIRDVSDGSSSTDTVLAQRGSATSLAAGRAQTLELQVPVTVELDGMVLARVMAEYSGSIRRDRFMNDPSNPLRGVET